MSIALLLLVLALICFGLAAFGVSSRVALTPLGLAFMVVAQLVGTSGLTG